MPTFVRATVLVAVSLGATVARASHTPDLTRAEERCQRTLGMETDLSSRVRV